MEQALGVVIAVVSFAGWLAAPAVGQVPAPVQPDLSALAAGRGAALFNRTLTIQKDDGRAVARLDARAGDGGALIDGVQLGEGVIEVDLRGKDAAQQSFVGVAFHLVDWTTYDAVYFRPFNFRASSAEARAHAVQYVSHPVHTWQKLRTERTGRFEKAIEPPPDPNRWFHARIVLGRSKVEVYVDHATTPSLVVDDLCEAKSGGVALWAGNGSDGSYAALTITPTAAPGPPPVSRQTIFQAAGTGNLTRLRALVEADATAANSTNPNGMTPLHFAAVYGQQPAADYLVSKGANPNAVARHSGTPLDLAYESGNRSFLSWLESKGGRFTPPRFDVITLTPAIHRVAFTWGMMNNVLVFSGTDGAAIVDTGFSTRALDELKSVVARLSPSGIRYVINTHPHADHVAGNALAPRADAVISAATLAAPPAGLALSRQTEPLQGRTGRTLPAGWVWRTLGTDITLIPVPGLHSPADLIVYFPKEHVAAMGDLLLSESMPAVDEIPAYLAFLENVLDVFPENTTFVSGHGRDLDGAGLRAYRNALNEMIGIVRTNLAAGRTAAQMVKDDVLKAYRAKYSLLDFLGVDSLVPRVVNALQKGTLK